MVSLRGVSKVFPNGNWVFRDVNLEVRRGEFVFVTGVSGAGKSTLLRLLYGAEQATEGTVIVDGVCLFSSEGRRRPYRIPPRPLAMLRRRLGVVFQDYRLLANRTLAENVAFVLRAQGLSPAEIRRRLVPTLKMVGLTEKRDCFPDELSGGEQQRLSLARLAGQYLKKTVLELGGSDPFIVLPSADLEAAVATAVTARLINNGQSCIAAKRFILHRAIAEPFTAAMTERFRRLKVGDPLDPQTDVGPLATPSILQEVDGQVQALVQAGAKVHIGGSPWGGNFYPPTILSDIPPDHPVAHQEVFGPVALLFTVPDVSAAIELANGTPFGLGASAWTTDPEEQERLLEELEAGSVFINGMVKSDPRLPFGGIKRSGYGRELSREGILEFVNVKTFWVK
jgi:succinate-semialdehyde dehydrogenase/glutarate-semialdehyde dehydrogenase